MDLTKLGKGRLAAGVPKIANDMACLAAQVISYFKQDVGKFYLYPASSRNHGEKLIYYVSGKAGEEPCIRVHDIHHERESEPLYEGHATDLLEWIQALVASEDVMSE